MVAWQPLPELIKGRTHERVVLADQQLLLQKEQRQPQDQRHHRQTRPLQAHFRPEFLNRLDESIIFHSLKAEELRQIVELQVKRLARRLEDKKLGLQVEDDALDWLAGVGYDPVYGARPLKRAIQRELETPIAKAILAGTFAAGSTIAVAVEAERLRFRQGETARIPALV